MQGQDKRLASVKKTQQDNTIQGIKTSSGGLESLSVIRDETGHIPREPTRCQVMSKQGTTLLEDR